MVERLKKHHIDEYEEMVSELILQGYEEVMNDIETEKFEEYVHKGIFVPTSDNQDEWLRNL